MSRGGVPIVFVHGAFTRARRWRPWVDYFTAAGHECHAVTLPGHDPSDPALLSSLVFEDYVTAVKAAVESLDRPPILIGHSMGGLVAQHVAAATRCDALILISSAPPWRTGATRYSLPYTFSYVLPVLTGRPMLANPRAAHKLVLHDLPEREQRELAPMFAYESGKAYRTMVFGQAPMRRGAVTCRVLCVNGGADRLLRPSVGKALARFYGAEHIVFPGHGHSLVSETTVGTVAASVLRWVEGSAVPPAEEPIEVGEESSFPAGAVV